METNPNEKNCLGPPECRNRLSGSLSGTDLFQQKPRILDDSIISILPAAQRGCRQPVSDTEDKM